MARLYYREEYNKDMREVKPGQIITGAQEEASRIGRRGIVLLILNRTIGSGIFVTSGLILKATKSVGQSLVIWSVGGVISICGTLIWNELGLSVPRHKIEERDGHKYTVPRNGGEKNYLEYIFKRPEHYITCVFGVIFICLGNLAGNAIAFGSFIMQAAGRPVDLSETNATKWAIVCIAIGASFLAVLIHVTSRRGGILVSHAFGFFKFWFLIAIIVCGILRRCNVDTGGNKNAPNSFDNAWPSEGSPNTASYVRALLYAVYSYSGFEQPFYVLAECKAPRSRFPKYTLLAVFISMVLFLGVNVAFFLVVDKNDPRLRDGTTIVNIFLDDTFGPESPTKTVILALVALSIFGNLVVMTFTASKVKQEIASEGILYKSLWFAKGFPSPWARYQARRKRDKDRKKAFDSGSVNDFLKLTDKKEQEQQRAGDSARLPEQTPLHALILHFVSSLILILVTAGLSSQDAYTLLVSLYSYVIILLLGFLVSGGLIFLRTVKRKLWRERTQFDLWGLNLVSAALYFGVCGFLLGAYFIKPPLDLEESLSYPYWLIPAIGLSFLLWGTLYYLLLLLTQEIRGKLHVNREPFVIEDPDAEARDRYLLKYEIITHGWEKE